MPIGHLDTHLDTLLWSIVVGVGFTLGAKVVTWLASKLGV